MVPRNSGPWTGGAWGTGLQKHALRHTTVDVLFYLYVEF